MTGLAISLPEGEFSKSAYCFIDTEPVLYQLTFQYQDGLKYTFRVTNGIPEEDISGLYYSWTELKVTNAGLYKLSDEGTGYIEWQDKAHLYLLIMTEGATGERLRYMAERLQKAVKRQDIEPDLSGEKGEEAAEAQELFSQLPEAAQEAVYQVVKEMADKRIREETHESTVQMFLREELRMTREAIEQELEDSEVLQIKAKALETLRGLSRQERYAVFDQSVYYTVMKGYFLLAMQNAEIGKDVQQDIIDSLEDVLDRVYSEEAEEVWLTS